VKLPFSKKIFAIGCGSLALLLLMVCALIVFPPDWHKFDAALDMGGLASLPEQASDCQIETSGSMFTRSFNFTFSAPNEEIKKWFQNSPGLSGIVPSVPSNIWGAQHGPTWYPATIGSLSYYRYTLPNGGYGEILVDEENGKVFAYVSWS